MIQSVKDVTVVGFMKPALVDMAQINSIGEELYSLVERKHLRKIVLDFSRVTHLSSSTLGVLLNLQNKAADAKCEVVLCGMQKDLKKIFKISKLDKLFTFYATEEKALNSFGVYTS